MQPGSNPTLDAAERWCQGRRISLLDLLEALEEALPRLVPPDHQIVTCGNCRHSSIVPLGSTLSNLRSSHGITLAEVAEAAGLKSRCHIADVEKGRRAPTNRVVAAYQKLTEEARARARAAEPWRKDLP